MKKLILVLLLAVSALAVQARAETRLYSLEHDGLLRTAQLYIPENSPTELLIVLHPLYSSGGAMEAITGLDAIAEERGWLIAYANASQPYWDDGRSNVALPPDYGAVDDVGFIAALADALSSEYGLGKVYLAGMGVGGTMAETAACQMPERFDGVAIVGALMWAYQAENCAGVGASAVNMLFIYGNEDHIYRQDGRTISNPEGAGWEILSADATLNHWANRNGCNTASQLGFSQTSLVVFDDCPNNSRTAFFTVLGGGNNWAQMGENQVNRFGVDASAIIGAFFGGDDDWYRLTEQANPAEMIPRTYILYVPTTYDASQATPLVIGLHGRGANGASQALSSDFNAVAEREGIIVVYPEAYDPTFQDPTWNYGLSIQGYDAPDWDDDAYLDMLVADLSLSLNIDHNRMYVTGISNGGLMSERLACTRSTTYAAFAPVAATAPYGLSILCEGSSPAPVLHIHGTADSIMPWTGYMGTDPTGRQFFITAPMENTMGFWAQRNGCALDFAREDIPNTDPDSTAAIYRFNDCPETAPLLLYAVFGGGHVLPGVRDFQSDLLGEVNMDFNGTEVIWEFFKQRSLDERSGE